MHSTTRGCSNKTKNSCSDRLQGHLSGTLADKNPKLARRKFTRRHNLTHARNVKQEKDKKKRGRRKKTLVHQPDIRLTTVTNKGFKKR